jgi:hypothetical protein
MAFEHTVCGFIQLVGVNKTCICVVNRYMRSKASRKRCCLRIFRGICVVKLLAKERYMRSKATSKRCCLRIFTSEYAPLYYTYTCVVKRYMCILLLLLAKDAVCAYSEVWIYILYIYIYRRPLVVKLVVKPPSSKASTYMYLIHIYILYIHTHIYLNCCTYIWLCLCM